MYSALPLCYLESTNMRTHIQTTSISLDKDYNDITDIDVEVLSFGIDGLKMNVGVSAFEVYNRRCRSPS